MYNRSALQKGLVPALAGARRVHGSAFDRGVDPGSASQRLKVNPEWSHRMKLQRSDD